ncbi:MmcQ/YjbR family DNA-binding protein [uncultured Eubacterium sp.]|uniref:MmcQ/YjbR family DNA-binding protein n=1 Tax=uncultured Eubacterium sp. TaxID=165185 RepID=UPI00267254CD|nr:MmcQ/YjbR family DNA-binding protein [uncultured Eubacterium sp.]
MVDREAIRRYVEDKYNTKAERLWAKSPNNEVLRHSHNRKWYAIIMNVQKKRVGLEGEEIIDVLNIKCEPEMVSSLSLQKGFCPAYHMNKEHWLTVILDGTVKDAEIFSLLDASYELTN